MEHEWNTDGCLKRNVKFPQSVMVWGAMSSAGVSDLCFLKSSVNATVYQDILEYFMVPAADQLFGDNEFIYSSFPAGPCSTALQNPHKHGVRIATYMC